MPAIKAKKFDSPETKLVNDLIECLKANKSPWRKPWSIKGSHRNFITGKPYKGSNPALLELAAAIRGHDLPLWAGVSQFKSQDCLPRKGSKAARVMMPLLKTFEKKDSQNEPVKDENGDPITGSYMSYKCVCVFNVSDIEPKTDKAKEWLSNIIDKAILANKVRPLEENLKIANEKLFVNWSKQVETIVGTDKAYYVPSTDKICIPKRDNFDTDSDFLATFAHEAGHSTGHSTRLDRDLTGRFGSKKYSIEELKVEIASFLICNRLNISSNVQNHAAYCKHWIEVLGEDPKVLFRILGQSVAITNMILGEE